MLNLLEGKVVAITGAASGIGRACAMGAAENGARVAAVDRAPSGEVAHSIADAGGSCIDLLCDVRDTHAVTQAFAEIEAKFGRLDALINCAGSMGSWPTALAETSDEDWDVVVDTNLKGVFACCRAALPFLRRSGAGAIANVASELGIVGAAGLVVYGASKAGVIQLSRALAVEEGANGIRVNCVCPGPVDTPFLIPPGSSQAEANEERREAASHTVLCRLGEPAEIANVLLFVVSERASFMTGSVIVVDGGVTAHD